MKRLLITTAFATIGGFAAFAQEAPQPPSASPPAVSAEPSAPSESMTPPAASEAAPVTPAPSDSTAAAPTDALPSKVTLTDDQAKEWVGKTVYTSDEKNIGEVALLARDASGGVTELQADIGGFLGLGETRVAIPADRFEIGDEKIILKMTEAEVKNLPPVPATAQ